jgi:hypothetical protein
LVECVLEILGDVDSVALGVEVFCAAFYEEIGGAFGEYVHFAFVFYYAAHGLCFRRKRQNLYHVWLVLLSHFSVIKIQISGELEQRAVSFVSDLLNFLTLENGVSAGIEAHAD